MKKRAFPYVRGVASVLCALTIAVLVPGCQSSGSASLTANGSLFGLPVNLGTEIEWGEPEGHLPPGSVFGGTITIAGREVAVYRSPDGCFWISPVGSDTFSKIVGDPFGWGGLFPKQPGGSDAAATLESLIDVAIHVRTGPERLVDTPDHPSVLPWIVPDDRILDAWYVVDLDADLARMEFTLPADGAHNYRAPNSMPFALDGWGMSENTDGSLAIWYQGAINDVLGAAMLQGIKHLSRDEPGVGLVEVTLSLEYAAAFVDVNGAPDTNGYAMVPIYRTR